MMRVATSFGLHAGQTVSRPAVFHPLLLLVLEGRGGVLAMAATMLLATSSVFAEGMIGIRMEESPGRNGIVIGDIVAGSPADRAGLRTQSRITHVDGRPTPDMAAFRREIDAHQPDDTVELTVIDQQTLQVAVKVAHKDARFVGPPVPDSVKEALEEVQDVGGSVVTDSHRPSRPVIEVTIDAHRTSDVTWKFLAAFSELRTLRVENWSPSARLTGAGLAELKPLGGLKKLSLPRAQLTAESAKQIAALTQLDALELNHAKVSRAALEPLALGLKLGELSLREVPLSADDMVPIGQMTSLRKLDLCGTKLNSAALAQIKSLTNLTYLDLEGTSIGDADAVQLAGLSRLEMLDLSRTAVTDRALVHLSKMDRLQELYLNFTGTNEPDIYDKVLKTLSENSTGVSPGSPIGAAFGEFAPTGRSGQAKTRGITAAGLEAHLKHLTTLRELQVSGPDFEPSDVRRLGRLWPRAKIVTSRKTINPPQEQR